jgi:predicted nuclease of predicted toxin-antitoxin system
VRALLLDECMSPRLVPRLWGLGIDTVHVRDRGMLQAPDHVVWRFAQDEERAVFTINGDDFKKIASQSENHHGLAVLPSGGSPSDQLKWVTDIVRWLEATSNMGLANRYIEISEDGEIVLGDLRLGQ